MKTNIFLRQEGAEGNQENIPLTGSIGKSIEDIGLISRELKQHLPVGGYVLFDLLLSNGDNFNRFAEAGSCMSEGMDVYLVIPVRYLAEAELGGGSIIDCPYYDGAGFLQVNTGWHSYQLTKDDDSQDTKQAARPLFFILK